MQFHYVLAQYRKKCRPQCGLHSNGGSEYYCKIMLIVLESGLCYYGGDVYVNFHKQLFPQSLASDHHSAETKLFHSISKIRQSLHFLLRIYSPTKLCIIYHIWLVNPNQALFLTAHKLTVRNTVLSYFILHMHSRNNPISDPLFSYDVDSARYSSHPPKYIVAVKPHNASKIYLLIQTKYHAIRTLWYMSSFVPNYCIYVYKIRGSLQKICL